MLVFRELDDSGLEILEEWFKDPEVLKRLGGTLPLKGWFQYVQQSPNYFAWLAYENGKPVGQLAMEVDADFSAAISLLTSPELRNKGYGKRMLNTLLQRPELSSVQIIKVGIEPDNKASLQCFKNAGYIEKGLDEEGFITLTLALK